MNLNTVLTAIASAWIEPGEGNFDFSLVDGLLAGARSNNQRILQFRKSIEAQWSFKIVDMDRRLVAFKDLSAGNITSWRWDFGDGEVSTSLFYDPPAATNASGLARP